jgi:hypothetical protein
MQHRLGLALLPANAIGLPFSCRALVTAADNDHAMVCTTVQGQSSMRHDILKGILRRIVYRAGVASTLEPALRRLPGLQAGVTAPGGGGDIWGLEGRGDVLMALGTRDRQKRPHKIGWSPTAILLCPFRWRHMAGLASRQWHCWGVWVWRLLGLLGWAQ